MSVIKEGGGRGTSFPFVIIGNTELLAAIAVSYMIILWPRNLCVERVGY